MAKQVLDVHAGKGMTTSQSNEHLRNANTGERLKKWSGNYDPSREKLNFEVGPGGVIVPVDKKSSIPSRIKKILKQRGGWLTPTRVCRRPDTGLWQTSFWAGQETRCTVWRLDLKR